MRASMTMEGLGEHRPDVLDELLARFGREIQTVAYVILRDTSNAEASPGRSGQAGGRFARYGLARRAEPL